MNDIQQKISQIDTEKIAEQMDEKGYIILSRFLPAKYCKELIDKYCNEDLYRKIITMEKYRFGWFQRASAQVQVIGREKPGPAQVIARPKRLNGDHAALLQFGFDHHLSFQYEIKPISRTS